MSLAFLLYKAAGADPQLIALCPRSVRNNYICMGVLIVLISMISFVTVDYMLLEINQPSKDWLTGLECFVLSIFWTLIVYNMLRLLVSSVGYGDGTSSMRVRELISVAAPLVVLALLGLCFATMLAVLLVQTDSQLSISFFYRAAHVWGSYFIVAIMSSIFGIFIYSIPVILRLVFWRKCPYDYLVEFQDGLTLANKGVIPKGMKFTYKNEAHYKPRYMQAEEMLKVAVAELEAAKTK